ncbi:MAG: SulP family inorganic anion transporter [Chloroflexi bacterium]|nr:SulP family inorganic anion transporter [Chloroflexota bacterium]
MNFRQYVNPDTIVDDVSAGLVLGVESIPDGMASGLLALVNPIYGVYGYMMGVFTGAFFTSSVYMSVQATGAMALVIASVPQVRSGNDPNAALFALAIITGVIMLAAGLLKLGSLIRFVPNSVMTGFINAVAFLIILGQLDDFTGYESVGSNKIIKALDLFANLGQVDPRTALVGVLTIILILTLEKTALKALGMVVALIAASLLPSALGWDSVALVKDIAEIPSSLPRPSFPPLTAFPGLVIPAFSLAFVGLMQGASISQSIPNPDGKFPNASGDFVGQGVANVVSGLFQGTPVGGSMSATSIVTNAGAKSRFANISAGIVMAVVILLFGKYVGMLAMPALAGLLIIVGFRTLKPRQVETVWKTGLVQQVVMLLTFVAALLIPLQFAVLLGVALAVLLFVFQQSSKVVVKEWVWEPGRWPIEKPAPEIVPSNKVTMLLPYGSLFFAAAPVFEEQLPDVGDDTRCAVVIIGLRGVTEVGSTLLEVLERYATSLRERESKLMLAGVHPYVKEQLIRTGVMRVIGRENIFLETETVGESGLEALQAAQAWIASRE